MIKRILILCILVAVSIYLIVAVTIFNRKPENQVCKGMELVVKDSVDYGFITEAEVTKLLKQKNHISFRQHHQRAARSTCLCQY